MAEKHNKRNHLDFIHNKQKFYTRKINSIYWFLYHISKNEKQISPKKLKNLMIKFCLIIYEQQLLQIKLKKDSHNKILKIYEWAKPLKLTSKIDLIDPTLHR